MSRVQSTRPQLTATDEQVHGEGSMYSEQVAPQVLWVCALGSVRLDVCSQPTVGLACLGLSGGNGRLLKYGLPPQCMKLALTVPFLTITEPAAGVVGLRSSPSKSYRVGADGKPTELVGW